MASRRTQGKDRRGEFFPEDIRNLPTQTQLAVLYERVQNLTDDVTSLRRTLQVFIGAIVSGAVLFLFSVAQGWIGKQTPPPATGSIVSSIAHFWGWL